MSASELIAVISKESDRYGYPHTLGFMEENQLACLAAATCEQLQEYINKYLGGKNHGNYHNERDPRF